MTASTSSEAQKSWNGQTDKVRRYSVPITKKKKRENIQKFKENHKTKRFMSFEA